LTLIDTHCHLDAPEFDADRVEVIARIWEAGVSAVVTIGTDLEGSRRAVALAESDLRIWATVGIDPHDAETGTPEVLAEVAELARHPRVVAIGEIGLDYYPGPPDNPWHKAPREVQQQVFDAQLAIAAEVNKPVVIHCRDAHDDVLAIIRDQWSVASGQQASTDHWLLTTDHCRGVMHCFSGTADQALKFVELGMMISLAGPLTFLNARKPVEVARRVPLDWLVVETDSPYLSPHPFRGKRNEPARVRLVAEKLAEVKGLPLDEVAATTTANARRLFRLKA
jgi:TatD DNase family protein